MLIIALEKKEKILKFDFDKIEILCYIKYKTNMLCSGLQELECLKRRLKSLKINRKIINNLIDKFND